MNEDYINVTAAIIPRGEEVLIAQRSRDQSSHPRKWEFPGGKVEPSETVEDCLRREVLEELGLQVQIERPFLVYEHDYKRPDGKKHRFHSFWCAIVEGEPSLKVHDSLAWARIEYLPKFDFIEADKQLVEALLENRKGGEAP